MGRYGIWDDDNEDDLDDDYHHQHREVIVLKPSTNLPVGIREYDVRPNPYYCDDYINHNGFVRTPMDRDGINTSEFCSYISNVIPRHSDNLERFSYEEYLIRQQHQQQRRQRRRRYLWYTILSIFIALIAYLCQHDRIPPGPPPLPRRNANKNIDDIDYNQDKIHHDLSSWNEYIHEHAYQLTHSFMILCYHIPVYVFQHWIKSAYIDLEQELMHLMYIQHKNLAFWNDIRHKTVGALLMDFITFLSNNGTGTTSTYNVALQQQQCQWHVPNRRNNSTSNIEDVSAYVIGQDIAIELLQNSITLWQQQQQQQNGPLILFATGYEHTGKRTMAYNMMTPSWRSGANCYCHRYDQDHHQQQQLLLHLHGRDWSLKDYEKDNSIEIINRARRLLYRKMIHTIQSHFYRTTNIANPNDQTHMILITNIEDMEPYLLIQFLSQIQKQKSNTVDTVHDADFHEGDNSLTHDTVQTIYSNDIYELCQNSIIYLTSNQYGLTEIARYLRTVDTNAITSSSSNVVTLLSDIRHTIHNEFYNNHHVDHSSKQHGVFDTIQILPFVPFSLVSLQQLLRYRVNEYFNQTIHQFLGVQSTSATDTLSTSMIVTSAALNAIVNERNVEYIEWRRTIKNDITMSSSTSNNDASNNIMDRSSSNNNVNDQEQTTYMKIVIDGANAIQDQNPIIMKLYTQIHQVVESVVIQNINNNNKNKDNPITNNQTILVLDYDTATPVSLYDRGTFLLCDRNSTVVEKIITSNTDSNIYDDETNTHCKVIKRFNI